MKPLRPYIAIVEMIYFKYASLCGTHKSFKFYQGFAKEISSINGNKQGEINKLR